jgi:hypothetical protein
MRYSILKYRSEYVCNNVLSLSYTDVWEFKFGF